MIATTIEQSKHLLELGLDPKTADMFWMDTNGVKPCLKLMDDGIFNHRNYLVRFPNSSLPAWSLSALLEVMPMVNEGWPVCCKIYGSEKWHVLYHSTAVTPKIDSGEYDTPIEAACQMVCWLLEQGLIKKGGQDE